MGTILLTPELDNRVKSGVIASRIGLQAEAYPFTPQCNLFEYVERELQRATEKIACVFLDEAHFLSKAHVLQLTEIVDLLNVPVLAYGLKSDYRGDVFEGSQYLLAYADEFIEIKTICYCGRKATMTLRFDQDGKAVKEGEQVIIGGNDQYIATCRKHFKRPLLKNHFFPSLKEAAVTD